MAIVSAANNGGGSDNGIEQGQQTQNGNGASASPTMNQTQSQNGESNNTETAGNRTVATEQKQVQARQQTQLQVRNTTMLMNCTNNCEVVFSSEEDIEPNDFQVNLEANQTMKLEMNLSKSPLKGAMVNERSLNFYLDIEPNATQFRAQIRLRINQTELNQNMNREVNASRLTWMYWNQTQVQWEKVESQIDQNGYLVCNTDHFSTWTVAEETPNQEPTPTTQDNDISVVFYVLGGALVLGVILVGVVAYRKRK